MNYRLQLEEQCQVAFSESARALQAARDVLEGIKKERNKLIRHFVKIQEASLNSDEIQRHITFIEYLKDKAKKQEAVIHKIEEEVNEKRRALLDAVKKRKVMEALREKKMADYLFKTAAKERKELDDFAVIKYTNGLRK